MRRILATLAVVAFLFGAGSAWADLEDAGAAYDRGDYETAIREYRPLAEKGEASAQAQLGWMYETGQGVPENGTEAVKWYRMAAEQGHAVAQYNLCDMYRNGEGVPENDAEAVKWCRMAAEQGYASAQYNLGIMYETGEGVPENGTEAVKWYRMAAEQGHVDAQYNLGTIYGRGEGVPVNNIKAYMWFSLAKAQGDKEAAENLDIVKKRMIPAQIAKAQELAAEWKPSSDEDELFVTGDLVKDLRSGKSNVRASSHQSSSIDAYRFQRLQKSAPDYKAIITSGGHVYRFSGHSSAEQAVEGGLSYCKEHSRQDCRVFAVGDNIVQNDTQEELADAIEAYQLEVSGNSATKPKNVDFKYCRTDDGSVLFTVMSCASNTEITKAEYDRLKNKKKDTASTTEPDAAFSGDDPLEAKLEKLQKLLEKGLITEEEAAAKRAKLLEDL